MQIFLKNTSIYFIKCFHPKKWPFYVLAAGLTYYLIYSGIDWKWFQFFTFREQYQYVLVSAALIGLFMPIIGPVILYTGLRNRDDRQFKTGYSLIQVVIIALLISSLMKACTGRPHPGFLSGPKYVDFSNVFHFSFLQGGMNYGWPSGHLMTTFSMIFCIIRRNQRNRVLLAICCSYGLFMLFGVSATIHWLSDSFAGAIIGILIGYTVDDQAGEIFKKKISEPKKSL